MRREPSVCLFQGEIGDRSCLLGMLLVMRSQETLPSSSVFLFSSVLSAQSSFVSLLSPFLLFFAVVLLCSTLFTFLDFLPITFKPAAYPKFSFNCLRLSPLFAFYTLLSGPFLLLIPTLHFQADDLLSVISGVFVYVCVLLHAHTRASVRSRCLSPLRPLFRGHRSSFRRSAKLLWNANVAN